MDSNDDVPTPQEDGVNGTQRVGDIAELNDSAGPPLQGQYLQKTLVGLATTRPRKFGGDFSAPLITAMVNQISHDRDQARDERDQARAATVEKQSELEKETAELNAQKLENARLQAQIDHLRVTGIFKQICAFFSPVLFSVAIDLYKGNFNLAFIVGGVAAVLLLINFLGIRGRQS